MYRVIVNVIATDNVPTGLVVLKYGKRTLSVGKLKDGKISFDVNVSEYVVQSLVAYYQGDENNSNAKSISLNYFTI